MCSCNGRRVSSSTSALVPWLGDCWISLSRSNANQDPFFANCEVIDDALEAGDLAKARELGAPDELAEINDSRLRRLALLEVMLAKASADDPRHPGWPGGAPDSQGGEFRPKDEATAQSDAPKQVASDKMSADEVGNIVFNETRSLSGKGIDEARAAIAHTVRNGEQKKGERRPKTAPSEVGRIPSTEAGTYRDSQNAATQADSERAQGKDPTKGATHFNITHGRASKPFEGHKHVQSYGPFHNSYTGGDVPRKKNIYINLYE